MSAIQQMHGNNKVNFRWIPTSNQITALTKNGASRNRWKQNKLENYHPKLNQHPIHTKNFKSCVKLKKKKKKKQVQLQ